LILIQLLWHIPQDKYCWGWYRDRLGARAEMSVPTSPTPRLSNDAQLMVFSMVKRGMSIDDALEKAAVLEQGEVHGRNSIDSQHSE
jgi:hypothetical protein